MRALLAAAVAAGLLTGCASRNPNTALIDLTDKVKATADAGPGDQLPLTENGLPAVADAINTALPVPDELRELRACLLVAGFGFLQANKARYGLADRAQVLGGVQALKNAVEKAKTSDPNWRNTHLGEAILVAGSLAINVGTKKVTDYLTRGLSVETAIFAAKNVAVDGVMIGMSVYDIRAILAKVKDGSMTEAEGWSACESGLGEAIASLS